MSLTKAIALEEVVKFWKDIGEHACIGVSLHLDEHQLFFPAQGVTCLGWLKNQV